MSQDSLSSWKEIAAYLKCDESTARRWERKNGMPVHRVGNKGGAVYAYPQEIDAWVRGGGREASDTPTPQERPAPAADPFAATSNPGAGPALADLSDQGSRAPFSGRSVTRFRRYLLSVAIVIAILAVTLWANHSASSRHHVSAQSASSNDNPVTGDPANADREEFTAPQLKMLVKQAQIWEMLTLYTAPWKCDAHDIERYWQPGSKAFLNVGESVSRLNERGWHYGYDAKLLNFEFRYVRFSRDGLSAEIGTREHWWLPIYTSDGALVPNRNPDQGPYELDYRLVKVNERWYLNASNTQYAEWRPQRITCANWPQQAGTLTSGGAAIQPLKQK